MSKSEPGEGTLLRWFRQLTGRKGDDKPQEKGLAADENNWRQFVPLTTAPPTPGEVIGDYEIIEKIGGNMGLVFKARHRLLEKVVALKLLPADWMADPARLARFQRELRVMGQLEHPNLVTAADARSVGAWHLVAMELIDGVDLQQLVRSHGPLSVPVACEVGRQAALGLEYAHQHGLIHRDIKPSNLMLTRSGCIKVIDMGLALTRDDTTAHLTQTGLVLGTMSYCAPEQFRDAAHVDIRADIYSLGCTLYHLLTGKPPYSHRKTVPEVVAAHLHEHFPNLSEARPDTPAKLATILERMTTKEREARFANPSEVVQALEPFAHGADLTRVVPAAKTQQTPPRRPSDVKLPVAPELQRITSREQPRKSRWRIAALLALLLAVGGALFLAANRSEQKAVMTGPPVVVLMDTTAPDGTYDDENKKIGASNAKEVATALAAEGVAVTSQPEPLYAGWAREMYVISLHPDLVIIHRSSFHHSYNAVLNLGRATNGFAHPSEDPRWLFLYNHIGDDKLITLLGMIGNEVPQTRFLVYSRGTDTNWLSDDFRLRWVSKVEERFSKLKDRITTMVIPNGYDGSFRQTETRKLIGSNVTAILKLQKKSK